MSSELRVAVLGAGNIGTVHLQSVEAVDGATVVAAADKIPGNRDRALALGAGRVYADYRSALEDNPDVAVIALPPSMQAEAAKISMRTGCDVFLEKPFARTVQEAEAILEVADETGRSVGVDHSLRYQDDFRSVRDTYEKGRLGHVPLATITRVNNGPFSHPPVEEHIDDWRLDPAVTGGGALIDLGVHLFDVLEWLFGDMEICHAELGSQLELPYEDTACVQLRSRSTGTTATLQCGFFQWEEPPDITSSLLLHGVTGSVDSREFRPDNFTVHAATAAMKNVVRNVLGGDPVPFEPTYFYMAHYRILSEFLAAVRAGREPPVSGGDGLRTVELVEAVYDYVSEDTDSRTVDAVRGDR